ncbi:GntR family transcriptional regulator [Thermotoga petrophila]|uniref:GntR family transcriptional regulator n=1 Tax=Thermotoga petrophila TaxID=93929 RepID=UPI0017C2A20E
MLPKYRIIEKFLIDEIKSGKYKHGDKLPTEKELMERFNASRETVRKALERLVVKNLVIRKPGLGTFVNIEKKNKVVGILVQQITSYIFPYIALGAEEVLFANGYKMLLGNASEDPHKERQIINEWLEVGVDGLIIDPVYSATKRSNRDLIGEIAKRGTKVVLVHTNWDIEGVGSVVLDDWYGGEKAAEIFYQYGHRNVAVLYKTIHLPSVVRAQAFLKRGRELGFEKVHEKSFHVSEFTGIVMQSAFELLSLPKDQRPTAVFCYNDATALQFFLAAKRMGLKIPEDVSVIGFDDAPIGDFREILTTFEHPKEEVGKKAVEILLKMIDGEKPEKYVFKPKLIMRESVTYPKK